MADAVRLLFVDDEDGIRVTLPPLLATHGFEVTAVDSVRNALAAIGIAPNTTCFLQT